MRSRQLLVAATALTLAAILVPPGAGAEPPPTAGRVKPGAPAEHRITLITGDQVLVHRSPGSPDRVVFKPGRGTGSTGAFTSHADGHTVVIPAAAMADVAAGRLDRQLFDVTTLLAERYDDARSATLPVIIQYAGNLATARTRAKQDAVRGITRTRTLSSIGARGVAIKRGTSRDFWQSSTASTAAGDRLESAIKTIRLDRRVRATIDLSVPQIGAPAAWQRGYTGRGVKVAVLDTGVDASHPDLTGRVSASANFSDSADTVDRVGHGTHVAGILAGTGAASAGRYRGVAPDATLLNGKVLDDYGFGWDSSVIAGMEWAVGQGAKVVNLSLGSGPSDGTDPVSVALNTLSREHGTLFVVAAGNCPFPESEQVSSPASADAALAVANLERDGSTSFSSCRGLRKGDFALKPEIAAPGEGIVAARAAGVDIGDPVGEHYTTLSGTSMATPHVAGTAALLAQSQPDVTADQLRSRLITTADPQRGPQGEAPIAEQGTGRVDADQATAAGVSGVSVDTAELEFGYLRWPHTDQQPITRTLTYRNPGTSAVTLRLAGATEALKLGAEQVVVPAAGTASVQVTADPTAASYGSQTGRITATADGQDPLVTAYGWYYEDERYEVTVRGINRDGSPANANVVIGRPDGKPLTGLSPEGQSMRDGLLTVRVPPGLLDVSAFFWQLATDSRSSELTLAVAPQVTAGPETTTVTLDAQTAKPADLSVADRPGLTSRYRVMRHHRTGGSGDSSSLYTAWITSPGIRYFATPTAPVTVGNLEYRTGGRLEVPPYQARSLGTGGSVIPVADVDWGARFTGIRDLVAVDAGAGTPAELETARGKLAVVGHDSYESWPDEILQAAQQAGVGAVLLHNPKWPGIDDADPAVGSREGLTVPVLRTSRAGARDLLALATTRPVTVRITGVQSTPVAYDLLAPTLGQVPADPGHVARTDRLARINETFGAHVRGMEIIEDRTPLSTLEPPLIISDLRVVPLLPAPFTRTSYVSPGPIQWTQHILSGFGSWELTPNRRYDAGSRSAIEWYTPVVNSGMPDAPNTLAGVHRTEGYLGTCFSPLDNGSDSESFLDAADSTLTVRRDGELLGSIDSSCAFVETPDGAAGYEVSLDTGRQSEWWTYSTKVRSTWTFRAAGGADEVMPVILADLDAPTASATSQVRTGVPVPLTLRVRHQYGSTASAVTAATLELSYDGTNWQKLPLQSAGSGRFVALVNHPHARAGQAVHLRVNASDAAGGTLKQEVTRAYGLVR